MNSVSRNNPNRSPWTVATSFLRSADWGWLGWWLIRRIRKQWDRKGSKIAILTASANEDGDGMGGCNNADDKMVWFMTIMLILMMTSAVSIQPSTVIVFGIISQVGAKPQITHWKWCQLEFLSHFIFLPYYGIKCSLFSVKSTEYTECTTKIDMVG